MNLEEARELMHKLNHGDAASGVDKADHVNLQDGITYDVEGIPSGVGEDTKIPLKPFNPLDEPEQIPLPADFDDVPDVNQDALAEWRQRKQR
jgi:hypothetical protein